MQGQANSSCRRGSRGSQGQSTCAENSRRTNPKDKRTYDIHPTEKAMEVYPALQGQVEAGFGRMTARMTEAQRAQFQRLLALAADACLEREE